MRTRIKSSRESKRRTLTKTSVPADVFEALGWSRGNTNHITYAMLRTFSKATLYVQYNALPQDRRKEWLEETEMVESDLHVAVMQHCPDHECKSLIKDLDYNMIGHLVYHTRKNFYQSQAGRDAVRNNFENVSIEWIPAHYADPLRVWVGEAYSLAKALEIFGPYQSEDKRLRSSVSLARQQRKRVMTESQENTDSECVATNAKKPRFEAHTTSGGVGGIETLDAMVSSKTTARDEGSTLKLSNVLGQTISLRDISPVQSPLAKHMGITFHAFEQMASFDDMPAAQMVADMPNYEWSNSFPQNDSTLNEPYAFEQVESLPAINAAQTVTTMPTFGWPNSLPPDECVLKESHPFARVYTVDEILAAQALTTMPAGRWSSSTSNCQGSPVPEHPPNIYSSTQDIDALWLPATPPNTLDTTDRPDTSTPQTPFRTYSLATPSPFSLPKPLYSRKASTSVQPNHQSTMENPEDNAISSLDPVLTAGNYFFGRFEGEDTSSRRASSHFKAGDSATALSFNAEEEAYSSFSRYVQPYTLAGSPDATSQASNTTRNPQSSIASEELQDIQTYGMGFYGLPHLAERDATIFDDYDYLADYDATASNDYEHFSVEWALYNYSKYRAAVPSSDSSFHGLPPYGPSPDSLTFNNNNSFVAKDPQEDLGTVRATVTRPAIGWKSFEPVPHTHPSVKASHGLINTESSVSNIKAIREDLDLKDNSAGPTDARAASHCTKPFPIAGLKWNELDLSAFSSDAAANAVTRGVDAERAPLMDLPAPEIPETACPQRLGPVRYPYGSSLSRLE